MEVKDGSQIALLGPFAVKTRLRPVRHWSVFREATGLVREAVLSASERDQALLGETNL